jgi:hypothetical protein
MRRRGQPRPRALPSRSPSLGVEMAALRVGDRVLFEVKTWRVDSLGRRAYPRVGAKIVNGELYATLLLEADPPGSQLPHRIVLSESKWDEAQLLEE